MLEVYRQLCVNVNVKSKLTPFTLIHISGVCFFRGKNVYLCHFFFHQNVITCSFPETFRMMSQRFYIKIKYNQ